MFVKEELNIIVMLVFPMKRAWFLTLYEGGNIQERSESQVASERGGWIFLFLGIAFFQGYQIKDRNKNCQYIYYNEQKLWIVDFFNF